MTRKDFWKWMATCPVKENDAPSGWFIAHDDGENIRIYFYFKEDEVSHD